MRARGRIVTVEKRKWAGPPSARWRARTLAVHDGCTVLIAAAGTPRARPARGTVERLDQDEVLIAGAEWWVATARLGGLGRPRSWKIDAATPAEWEGHDLLPFTDLDLDLVVNAAAPSGKVVDRAVFEARAERDGYPPEVMEGAEEGLRAAVDRLARDEPPFGGWLEGMLSRPLVRTA